MSTDSRKILSVSKAFTAGWNYFRARPFFFATVTALILLTAMISGSVFETIGSRAANEKMILLPVISFVLIVTIGELLKFGLDNIALRTVDEKRGSYSDLETPFRQGVRYLLGLLVFDAIVVGVPSVILYLAFVITGSSFAIFSSAVGTFVAALLGCLGLFLGLVFHLFPYLILDRDTTVQKAFIGSKNVTQGGRFELVLFYVVSALLNGVGLLLFGVGLLATLPITILAQAHAYRQLADGASSA